MINSHCACMVKSSMLMSVHGDNVLVYGEEYCVDVCVCIVKSGISVCV